MEELEELTQRHSHFLTKKIDSEEFVTIKKYVSELPTHKQVTKLKNYVNDSINHYQEEHQTFKEEFEVQNEIIRRYDEVMT